MHVPRLQSCHVLSMFECCCATRDRCRLLIAQTERPSEIQFNLYDDLCGGPCSATITWRPLHALCARSLQPARHLLLVCYPARSSQIAFEETLRCRSQPELCQRVLVGKGSRDRHSAIARYPASSVYILLLPAQASWPALATSTLHPWRLTSQQEEEDARDNGQRVRGPGSVQRPRCTRSPHIGDMDPSAQARLKLSLPRRRAPRQPRADNQSCVHLAQGDRGVRGESARRAARLETHATCQRLPVE